MKTYLAKKSAVNGIQQIVIGLLLATGLMITPPAMAAGPLPVDLGSAARFTILAGAAVTTTGGGTITGDVGASPITGAAILVTDAQVIGTIYAVDAAGPAGSVTDPTLLTAAKGDMAAAYNDAAGRTPIPTGPYLNPNGGNIGGQNLAPGLYKFTDTAMITGSDLTLTGGADDVWIFQITADLQVGSGIQVILAGGAQAANIFWQVGTSAVLDTSSVFKGTILADQAITMNTSSTLEGRALAFVAGITFNGSSATLPTDSGGGDPPPVDPPPVDPPPVDPPPQPASLSIRANGTADNVTINYPATVSVTVEMSAGDDAGDNKDWWVVARAEASWFYLDNALQWIPFDGNLANCRTVYQGALLDLETTEVLNIPALPVGSYTVWFAVDSPMDGVVDLDGEILLDLVDITVQ